MTAERFHPARIGRKAGAELAMTILLVIEE